MPIQITSLVIAIYYATIAKWILKEIGKVEQKTEECQDKVIATEELSKENVHMLRQVPVFTFKVSLEVLIKVKYLNFEGSLIRLINIPETLRKIHNNS